MLGGPLGSPGFIRGSTRPPFLFTREVIYAWFPEAFVCVEGWFCGEVPEECRQDEGCEFEGRPHAGRHSSLARAVPCYSPIQAWKPVGGGKLIFRRKPGQEDAGELTVPCGQCIGCRLDRSVAWAIRVMHESQMHDSSIFGTFTYDDEHLPYGETLYYRHFQLFMRKLRKRVPGVRFFMCGEYGDTFKRPHYHAALFGVFLADRYPWRKSSAGFQLYRSPLLDSLWEFGSAEFGELSFESAAYVARYCVKKVTGERADSHYAKLVLETGEVIQQEPEFMRCSLKPGIGAKWFEEFRNDLFCFDGVIVDGRTLPIPRFYREMFSDDELSEYVMRMYGKSVGGIDSSYERLRVREIVARAGLSLKLRNLE